LGCWNFWVGLLEFGLGCRNFGLLEFLGWVAGIWVGLLEFFFVWLLCLVAVKMFGCCEKLIWVGVGYFWWEVMIKK
jgi:hypothetical protein